MLSSLHLNLSVLFFSPNDFAETRVESFTGSSKKTSNNVLRLQRFLEESNILHALNTCIVGHCTLEIQALLACLAHWYLHPLQNLPHVSYYVFPTSRLIVYSKLTEFPIFLGDGEMAAARVNVYTVLHMINFWRYHTNETDYGVLNDISHMRGWTRPTEEHGGPSGLSRHWNGISGRIHHCYKVGGLYLTMAGAAYLYDFSDMRSLREHSLTSDPFFIGREVQLDELDECRDVEAIEFDFEQAHNTAVWPKAFEDHLQALPPVPFHSYNKSSTRADDIGDPCTLRKPFLPKSQKMVSLQKCSGYLRFSGSVEPDDYGPNYQGISGILHDLPEQSGIPGFQRISFMQYAISAPKHEGDDDDHVMGSWRSKVLHDQVDETCYCYQGVVLPGGQIILGRWWSPFNDADQLCTGPFMLWAVEE